MTKKDDFLRRLRECSLEERLEIFKYLRTEIPIHALEAKLNTPAELILEAMDRGSDLTIRGIRGIIAEAAFIPNVLEKLHGWTVVEIVWRCCIRLPPRGWKWAGEYSGKDAKERTRIAESAQEQVRR